MKGIYIAAIDYNKSNYFGVYKKITGQLKALRQLDIDVDSILIKDSRIVTSDCVIEEKIPRPLYMGFHKLILKYFSKKLLEYDFVYLRFSRNDIYFLKLIKYLSKNNIKVIVEIPTYPYNEEYDYSFKQNVYRTVDKYVTMQMHKYVYRIATTNSIDEIFNINTIQIRNGVDLEEIAFLDKEWNTDCINLVGIANLAKWHGYDRIIRGISDYKLLNKNYKKVNFYIIGDGDEKENLVKLTEKLNLVEQVHFLGPKRGVELTKTLYNMDIGVSSLALFRAGGGHDPIKTKEFLAQGFPVILGYDDKLIDMNLPYILTVPKNDDAVVIEDIVKFYESLDISKSDIRQYAEDYLSWTAQMKKVIDELQINV